MSKLGIAFALAFAVCLISSPVLSRAATHSGTTTCEGRVAQASHSIPGWYEIDVCFFYGNTSAGKAILDACGIGNPCRIEAFGEWAPDFFVKRIISAKRIDKKDLNEMPEEYQGTWNLYRDQGEHARANSTEENRMPVGSKGIGWLNGVCNVTSVERNETSTTVVKESCVGRGKVTELWSLHKSNGVEMLIVATIGASSPAFTPYISIYVRDLESNQKR